MNQQTTMERKRQEPPTKPSNCIRSEQGRSPSSTEKQIPESGTGHGNTAAARGSPAQEPRTPEAQRAPRARQKDPCVPDPGTHLTECDPHSLSSAVDGAQNKRTPGPGSWALLNLLNLTIEIFFFELTRFQGPYFQLVILQTLNFIKHC
jgi:hypothetical protein